MTRPITYKRQGMLIYGAHFEMHIKIINLQQSLKITEIINSDKH